MAKAQDIKSVWQKYGRSRSDKLRNLLMEHYMPLVEKTAQRIHMKLPREVELDDLISAGTFGLMYAIEAFDPKRAVKFETYCSTRIRGAILDELRSWDWVPRLARMRAHKLAEANDQLLMELGREPSPEELGQRLQASAAEVNRIRRDGTLVRILPLSRPQSDWNSDDEVFPEMDEEREHRRRADEVEREDVKEMLAQSLSRAERLIVTLYYFEQMTMREIGATLNLSESRVSQMHGIVLSRLHEMVQAKRERQDVEERALAA